MPVSVIFENLEAGANIDDIMEWFQGLDREQIKAVIEFAARSLDDAPFSVVRRWCWFYSIRARPFRCVRSYENIRVETAYERGWDTLTNGELLRVAETAGFHVFVTPGKSIRYQQNLRERTIAIVVVGNPQWLALRLHVERVAAAVNCATSGSYTEVQIPEAR
jgi:hypothetical protein